MQMAWFQHAGSCWLCTARPWMVPACPGARSENTPQQKWGDWTKFGEKGTGQDEAAFPLMSLGWRAAESPRQQRHIWDKSTDVTEGLNQYSSEKDRKCQFYFFLFLYSANKSRLVNKWQKLMISKVLNGSEKRALAQTPKGWMLFLLWVGKQTTWSKPLGVLPSASPLKCTWASITRTTHFRARHAPVSLTVQNNLSQVISRPEVPEPGRRQAPAELELAI